MRPSLALAIVVFSVSVLQGAERPPLRVLLTVSPELPERARAPMVHEATAIWRRAGVTIAWSSGVTALEDDSRRSTRTLRVLVVSRAAEATEERWPVGELVPTRIGDSDSAIGFVSIDGARRVLTASGSQGEPGALGEHRLGVVLGRALAHEIGHFLLGTRSHAASGLMRARIDAAAFADLKTGGFFLDETAARWIGRSLAPGPHAAPAPGAVPRFDYGNN